MNRKKALSNQEENFLQTIKAATEQYEASQEAQQDYKKLTESIHHFISTHDRQYAELLFADCAILAKVTRFEWELMDAEEGGKNARF
jgi:hypothetical protein